MSEKILVVEDDKDIQELIVLSLSTQNIGCIHTADNIDEAKELLLSHDFQVVLLDLNLKSENGYQLLKYINSSFTKVLIVTAKDSEIDVYKGFEQGAIDYIKKPFDPIELAYRVKVHIKPSKILKFGHLTIDRAAADVYKNEQLINLTAREYDLLLCFSSNNNQILSKEQLYVTVWGYDTAADDNTLMVHIRTLRKKIELDPDKPELIKTVRGHGYIFKGIGYE
ncbi:DNA-binding response regulator [Jeotgalicoccus coquinae]|uniref:DNA-binding response OmpR family regulator n=1 Tax=Jeotgalicoccus coquinae TaxID=709509 RepID=A0A6V7RR46_9STAP|nr:response regulator transcription factor [Jeotgalicoccus coquinae]MBB6424186.1 DNA-binding response OmpR family regulator [Jeotgalicoccus coquinae]GGE25830.1 DNA-binding response regulator [Jeotgalicoccus coquinae]CAD2081488.1 Response regulator ArlR [Jeotgalicoccus coquinae]